MRGGKLGKGEAEERRAEMVRTQLAPRGIDDERVLAAFGKVARERFVPGVSLFEAYADHPMAIGSGQTISQPYMVALMLMQLELRGGERALEIGTGSGYQTALLAELCAEVYTVERIGSLAVSAEGRLREMGYGNVRFLVGDGTLGWPGAGLFEAIVVSAGGPRVPESLRTQLADGGRMAIPVGETGVQDLLVVERRGEEYRERSVCPCMFVKLVGEEGWGE